MRDREMKHVDLLYMCSRGNIMYIIIKRNIFIEAVRLLLQRNFETVKLGHLTDWILLQSCLHHLPCMA